MNSHHIKDMDLAIDLHSTNVSTAEPYIYIYIYMCVGGTKSMRVFPLGPFSHLRSAVLDGSADVCQ